MKAIIPAAGLGTRFLPVTKSQPKEMLPIVDKPVIQYVVEEAAAAGADDILIITGRGKRAIEDHFDRSIELEDLLERAGNTAKLREVRNISEIAEVFYVRQKKPRGLGHAVMCGAPFVSDGEPFYVMLGDVLVPGNDCLPRLKAAYDKYGASVVAVTNVERHMVSRYGIIAGEEVEPGVWKVSDLIEKPSLNEAPSQMALFGRYLLTPTIQDLLPKIEPGYGGEIQLTDAVRELVKHEPVYAVVVDGQGYDTGNVLAWLEANVALALSDADQGPDIREMLNRVLGSVG